MAVFGRTSGPAAVAVCLALALPAVSLADEAADYSSVIATLKSEIPGVITVRSVLDMHSGIPGDIPDGAATTGRP